MGNKLSSTKPRQNSSSGDLDRETHGRWRQSNAREGASVVPVQQLEHQRPGGARIQHGELEETIL